MSRDSSILVIGAGPVGSVAALACAQRGHPVCLVEADHRINDSPRASTTQPPTLEIIAGLGLIDEYIAQGLVARVFQFWDRPTKSLVAEFDFERLRGETPFPYVVQTEQHKLANMSIARLRALPNAQVHLGMRVTDLEQTADRVVVRAVDADGAHEFVADYVIACDGGRSTVRKALDIEFEGFTWPERFLVITTRFDFQTAIGCSLRNYMAGPEEWTNLFKVAGDDLKGRWRAVYNTRPDESDAEAVSDTAVRARLARCYAEGADWEHLNLYNVHQRVAKQFRKGRVFLAGDAAHVNNPIGGLGLNSGIHEVWDLADLLDRVIRGEADAGLLDAYERRRRPLNIEYVQEQTVANKRRLEEADPARREARFHELRTAADDPARHRAFLLRASLIESARRAETLA
ncbi:MAG: FAD-dependent monooxygenase [Betaproteobacteria bacterium]|jgi:3-(3-hydroxy-phenyl)propionate hydroxylase|nr:FAD-dependent monooxygenase [Betaproteobacteria bacterium]